MVRAFGDIRIEGLSGVGGKGLNLGRMAQAGLPVPPGFVITTEAFRLGATFEVTAAIREAYAGLGSPPVAVRSSATAEDLEDASFAGQQDTFLNVSGEGAVLDAVRRCWASLHTERARAYRASKGIPDEQVAMAVVVQEMVPAERAGVLFTCDPTDPTAGRVLVEAVAGLGEALVSGAVTPDRWALDAATGTALSADERCKSGLTAQEIQELLQLAGRVKQLYGSDQDIEWAIAAGRVYLLQSRPITATSGDREALRCEEIGRLRARAEPEGTVWARYSLAEVLPEPLPFTWALWKRFMSGGGGYGRMYRELGYDPDPYLDEDGILDLIAGRPYFNLSRDAKLYFAGFPHEYPFSKLKDNPSLAVYPQLEVNLARAPKGFLLKMIGFTRRMMAAEKTLERTAQELPDHLENRVFPAIEAVAAELRATDLSSLTDTEVRERIVSTRRAIFEEFAPQGLKASILAGLSIAKLQAEVKPKPGEEKSRQQSDTLLAGVSPPERYDLAGALRRLASGALTPTGFIEGFGHRGPGEMELANPRWREAPQMVEALAFSPRPAPPQSPADAPAGKATLYLRRARLFTGLREASKHCLMLGYEGLRLLLLELDRRRALKGGIFYLEPDELEALVRGEDLRARIAERRKRRALALGLEAPRVIFSDDLEAIGRPLPRAEGGEELSGTGVSAGAAEGPALVLRSPEEAPADARDFILVCPSTDPGWVPLFLRARGVVLETGGVLSHGAIVARELGLPAVANVSEACTRLRSGQVIRVDGTQGKVWPTRG
jgi:rifampicin phosphotransferase